MKIKIISKQVERTIEKNNHLKFQISGINYTIANTLRRFILTEVPSYSFTKKNINVDTNTSVYDNDHLKMNLENLPVYSTPPDLFKDEEDLTNNFTMYCEKKNDNIENYQVTTDDCEFYLNSKKIKSPYKTSIWLVTLQQNEQVKFTAQSSVGTGKNSALFSPVGVCVYSYEEDKDDIFTFNIESRGQYKEIDVVKAACDVIVKRLTKLVSVLKTYKLEKEMILTIPNENHTMGCIMSHLMRNHSNVEFCGYKMPHPLIEEIEIKYVIKGKKMAEVVIKESIQKGIKIFENIKKLMK